MADVDLDARLDALFATEPGEFVATRDALVRDLRVAGRGEDAEGVKALRRPTLAVAAINETVRREPDRVRALIETGEHLAALQAQSSPDRDELRALTQERRALLHHLTEIAASTAARPDGVRASITATFDVASLDDDLRDELLRGRLTHELSPATRFVLGDEVPVPPTRPRPARRSAPSSSPPPDELAIRRARAELTAVRERAEAADVAARERADAAADATEALAAAQRRVDELERTLADARSDLADARRRERDAQRAETRARAEHERVAAALRAAERATGEEER